MIVNIIFQHNSATWHFAKLYDDYRRIIPDIQRQRAYQVF
jgi:hypothetical protein